MGTTPSIRGRKHCIGVSDFVGGGVYFQRADRGRPTGSVFSLRIRVLINNGSTDEKVTGEFTTEIYFALSRSTLDARRRCIAIHRRYIKICQNGRTIIYRGRIKIMGKKSLFCRGDANIRRWRVYSKHDVQK